ncbi:MAG: hypothetical protein J7494_04440 [Sphingobium sp.]|nr:hypothetical protein [Sphingobium sp.]
MSDRDKEGRPPAQNDDLPKRGPLGDVLPGKEKQDPRTRGGLPPEKVEDRPNVGTVKPEDYPEQQ